MRRYIATLHKKPEHHKKRFALLVSGGFTLFVFAIWTLVMFGSDGTLAKNNAPVLRAHREVSPIESMWENLSSSIEGLREAFGGLKDSSGTLEIEDDYLEMRNNVLNVYGQ